MGGVGCFPDPAEHGPAPHPEGGRERERAAEDVRVPEVRVERRQAAPRRAAGDRAHRAGDEGVRPLHGRHQRAHHPVQEAVGLAALATHGPGRQLVLAAVAAVRDGDHDRRRHGPPAGKAVDGLVNVPAAGERSLVLEDVLTVEQVEHRAGIGRAIAPGDVDPHRTRRKARDLEWAQGAEDAGDDDAGHEFIS